MSAPTEIVGVRNDVRGFFVALRCRGCRQPFERYQPSLAGLALGEHVCPGCGERQPVEPEPFLAAVRAAFREVDRDEARALATAASAIAEGWHTAPPLASLLQYRGVALGPPTERELLALFVRGLFGLRRGPGA